MDEVITNHEVLLMERARNALREHGHNDEAEFVLKMVREVQTARKRMEDADGTNSS